MRSQRRGALWWTLIAVLVVGVLGAGGFGAWQVVRHAAKAVQVAPADSAQARRVVLDAAKTDAVKILSYTPDTVEANLTDAAKLTTGDFHDTFTKLVDETVIPGAKSKSITSVATVPAAAVESLEAESATLIVFVNQTTTVPPADPNNTASTVRMKLQKVNGDWLIAAFDPI